MRAQTCVVLGLRSMNQPVAGFYGFNVWQKMESVWHFSLESA
jgi:hypothetical protein